MKKLLYLMAFFPPVVLAVFLGLREDLRPVIKENLSKRAKEYAEERKLAGEANWRLLSLGDNNQAEVLGRQLVTVGDCFSLEVPFPILHRKQKDGCFRDYSINSPRGKLVVYQQKTQLNSLDEMPAVMLRRSRTDLYQEEKQTYRQREFVIFKKTNSPYEKNVFYLSGQGLFVLNLTSYLAKEDLDDKLAEMLGSLVFYNE